MTLANFGFLFLGAMLVAGGILVASLADRVRGLRISRRESRRAVPRQQPTATAAKAVEIDPADTIFVPDEDPADTIFVPDEDPKAARRDDHEADMADVIAALVAVGYNKRAATRAVKACTAIERGSLTDWTRAALLRSREEAVS